jgi:hypothetical protein
MLTGEGIYFRQLRATIMSCEETLSEQESRVLLRATYRFEIDPKGRPAARDPTAEHRTPAVNRSATLLGYHP